jgi:hypothetical protein
MKGFSKKNIVTFISGICMGIVIILAVLIFSNNAPFLKAAEVDSGAKDINARYLDGYGTSLATSSSKVYISDGSGYLPDGSVDTGAILDGTIMNVDVNASAAIDSSKTTGARPLSNSSADITVTTSMCSGSPCSGSFNTCNKVCTSQGYVGCDHYHMLTCNATWSTVVIWNPAEGSWSNGTGGCAWSSYDREYVGADRMYLATCYK